MIKITNIRNYVNFTAELRNTIQIFPGHYCIGYIIYNMYCWIFGTSPTLLGIILAIGFALLPDIDVFLLVIDRIRGKKSGKFGVDFKHHEFPTHFPIIYSPLIVIVIIFPNTITVSIVTAVYLHLLVDSFYTSDGVKWLYPFKSNFYGLKNENTLGKHGIIWQHVYMKTPLYKLEFVLLVATGLILFLNHIIYYQSPIWAISLLGGLLLVFFIGAFLIERMHVKYVEKKVTE